MRNLFQTVLKLLLSLILLPQCITKSTKVHVKATTRLYKRLLSGYDKHLRPADGSSNATIVSFDVTLKDIKDIVEGTLEAEIKANVWVSMQWKDPRLAWNPSQYPTKTFVIDPSRLWIPDIRLYNSLDPKIRMDDKVKAEVRSDGRVSHIVPMWLVVHCARPRLPNATWECPFRFGSWVYNGYQLDIAIRKDGFDVSEFSNKVWGIVENKSDRSAITRRCCTEPWPQISYTLRVIRR